jgi:hypothetical protein
MPEKKWSSRPKRRLNLLIGLIATIGLGGCADYSKRRDTITFSAGEAQAWNKTVHVADPWPAHASNTRIDGDGQRVGRVIRSYSTGAAASPPTRGAPLQEGQGTNDAQSEGERPE